MPVNIDKGLKQRYPSTFFGSKLIVSPDQEQAFLPITIQMCKKEAIDWAESTKKAWLASGGESWFNPLIIEHHYETMVLYLIARPFTEGKRRNESDECILEILIN